MPSLSFQKQFVPGVLAMLDPDYARRNKVKPKTTTIRAMRKRPFKKGDKLFLFSGLRTTQCKRLGECICMKVENIRIVELSGEFIAGPFYFLSINGTTIMEDQVNCLAAKDGFKDGISMMNWFKKTHGLPFIGQRITMLNTYDRKYYLHKRTKDLDLNVRLTKCLKTIEVAPDEVDKARHSKHVAELQTKYQYGVQIINPLYK